MARPGTTTGRIGELCRDALAVLAVATGDDHVGSRARQSPRERVSDTTCSTGDHCNPVSEVEQLQRRFRHRVLLGSRPPLMAPSMPITGPRPPLAVLAALPIKDRHREVRL